MQSRKRLLFVAAVTADRKVLLAQVSSRRQQQTLSRRLEDIELEESLERGRNCSSNT